MRCMDDDRLHTLKHLIATHPFNSLMHNVNAARFLKMCMTILGSYALKGQ